MTASTNSLGRLLARRLALIALAVALVNLTAVALRYASQPEELARSALQRQVESLAAGIAGDGAGLRIAADRRAPFDAHPSDYAFVLVDAAGATVASANSDLLPLQRAWLQDGAAIDADLTHAGRRLRVAARAIDHDGESLRLVVGMTGDPDRWLLRALLDELATHVALPLVPVMLLLIGTSATLVRRAMAPVMAAAAWARALHPGAANPAPPTGGTVPDEVADLVDALGRALERLESALSAERRRSAEAAHALRTPLAVLAARIDALPPGPATDALARDIRALTRTVQQLLSAATADIAAPGTTAIDLADIAAGVAAQLAPFAHVQGATLSLHADPRGAAARAAPAAVELALGNLVENAVLHGGRAITIEAGPSPLLRVRDDGPSLPAGHEQAIFEPFQRGPQAAPGGAGLGLSIVRRAMASQDGAVEARNPPQGGAEFSLRFRAAAD